MSDEIDDRLSKRFEGSKTADEQQDDSTESSEASQKSQKSQINNNSQKNKKSQKSQKAQKAQKAQNVKKEWNVRSIYLDDDLDRQLLTAFKRLDLELSEAETDINLKKTRHFYPLLVELGLERLESMDLTEVTERLEEE